MPIFRVKSVNIYTGQKKFTRIYPWDPWQIWGMPGGTVITGATGMSQQKNIDFLHMVFEDQRGSFPAPSHG